MYFMCRMGFFSFQHWNTTHYSRAPHSDNVIWRLFFHSAVRVTLNLYNIHPFPQSPIPTVWKYHPKSIFREKNREDVKHAVDERKKNMWVEEEEENPNPKTSSLFGGWRGTTKWISCVTQQHSRKKRAKRTKRKPWSFCMRWNGGKREISWKIPQLYAGGSKSTT